MIKPDKNSKKTETKFKKKLTNKEQMISCAHSSRKED